MKEFVDAVGELAFELMRLTLAISLMAVCLLLLLAVVVGFVKGVLNLFGSAKNDGKSGKSGKSEENQYDMRVQESSFDGFSKAMQDVGKVGKRVSTPEK